MVQKIVCSRSLRFYLLLILLAGLAMRILNERHLEVVRVQHSAEQMEDELGDNRQALFCEAFRERLSECRSVVCFGWPREMILMIQMIRRHSLRQKEFQPAIPACC